MTLLEFAKRKTEEASRAVISPYITDFERPFDAAVRVENEWSRAVFGGPFYLSPVPQSSRPSSNLVFVQSLDGNTAVDNPAALGGGATDTHVVYEGLSRVAADGVLVGAETIRGGGLVFSVWHPQLVPLRAAFGRPRHPVQIVATLRGLDLTRGMLFNTPAIPVVLITVASSRETMRDALAARPWIQIVEMDRPDALPEAFAALRAMGIERLSCVGGRTIATQLIDAKLIDDVCVTTSPRTGGEPGTPIYSKPLPVCRHIMRKQGTGPERGVVFDHYAFH